MDLLALVQSLHQEAKLTGAAPDAVTGQSGRDADLVRWCIEAYNDIQRAKDGKWKWLRGDCHFDTIAATGSYASTAVQDTDDATAITRFRSWDMDNREPPLIFLSADGKVAERELFIDTWTHFRYLYVRGTHAASYPGVIAIDSSDNIRLGPTPDDVYRVTGNYWKANQNLAADTDVPEMPADYHMMVVWRAITKYAYNTVSHEVLARAQSEGGPLWDALAENQGYARFSITIADALA